MPVVGSSLTIELVGVGPPGPRLGESQPRRLLEDDPQFGLGRRQALAGADEEGHARPAPVVDLEAQRRIRLRGRVRGTSVDRAVAVVLPAHVVGRVGRAHRPEDGHHRVLERLGVARGGRLHGGYRHHLHEVVDDHVPQRSHGIVEMPAVLDSEVLRHRDLHARDRVAVPDRLEHRVREPQVEDLREAHLAEEVVDPVELRFVDVAVDLVGEGLRRLEIVAERLFDDDARVLGQAGLGQPLDHRSEEEGRDLQVEDRIARIVDGACDALERAGVSEVARHVRQSRGEALEHLVVHGLAARLDRLPRPLPQVLRRPVVDRHAHDRAAQEASRLEPVERVEGHHLRQVARDAEDDQHVGGLLFAGLPLRTARCGLCRRGHHACSSAVAGSTADGTRPASPRHHPDRVSFARCARAHYGVGRCRSDLMQ